MKHSTNVVAIIILSIFEGDVRKGTSEGGKAFYERSGKTNIWKLKLETKGEYVKPVPILRCCWTGCALDKCSFCITLPQTEQINGHTYLNVINIVNYQALLVLLWVANQIISFGGGTRVWIIDCHWNEKIFKYHREQILSNSKKNQLAKESKKSSAFNLLQNMSF